MPVYPTLELGDPALRQPAPLVADPLDPATQALLADLRATLSAWRAAHGWGRALSAPTIGVALRVVLIMLADAEYVLINPRFEKWSSAQTDHFESCITFPGLWGCVTRPASIVVSFQDAQGQTQRLSADGDLARIIQHEIDHLDGLVWLDRQPDLQSLCTTAEYRRRYKPD